MGKSDRGIAAYKKIMGQEIGEGLIKTGEPAPPVDKQFAKKQVANKQIAKTEPAKKPPRKTIKLGPALKPENTEKLPASKFKRAAQFMVLIGSDEAAKILSKLEPSHVEAISKEIVSLRSISTEEAEAILDEFRSLLSPSYGYSGLSSGGPEEARRLLYAAFGPEKGESILVKAVPELVENPFDFLSDFSAEQLKLLFKDESPAACAMVFSRLPPKLSAEVLANTEPERKLEIIKRIARLSETPPDVIDRVAAALKEKARHYGRSDTGKEIDGKNVLAAILKHSDLAFGDRLLEKIEEDDPSLSREMKDRLYTLEDVCDAADRPIQTKLASMADKDIVLLIKSRSAPFTQKILGNLSRGRAERVMEEAEIMGPVPKIEIEAAAREFLAWFRMSREEGRILMLSDEDVFV